MCSKIIVWHFHMSHLVHIQWQVFRISRNKYIITPRKSNKLLFSQRNTNDSFEAWHTVSMHCSSDVTLFMHSPPQLYCIGICFNHLHKCGDALYTVKVIWVDSSGRALCSGCPHSGPECHGNSPALHGHSQCQPGQSLTLLGHHPGKVHWAKKNKKLRGPGNSIQLPFWTVIQCTDTVRTFTHWSMTA